MPPPELSEQIRELTDRLVGAPHLDKTGSWIRGKMTRPSLDSLGNWLGGRLTEFVAGNEDSPATDGDTTPHESKTFAGPFSHYSTITPSTTSKVPSPQPTTDHSTFADAQKKLPERTGSAQAVRSNPQVQITHHQRPVSYQPVPLRRTSPKQMSTMADIPMPTTPRMVPISGQRMNHRMATRARARGGVLQAQEVPVQQRRLFLCYRMTVHRHRVSYH